MEIPRAQFLCITILSVGFLACSENVTGVGPALLNLSGEIVHPVESSSAPVSVFLFARTDCPISNRYAPEIRRLHEKFGPKGVKFYLVYPNPDESPEEISEHLDEYGYSLPALRDPNHELVELTGAKITPEAAVFHSSGDMSPLADRMVYRGRIDDRYVDFGEYRPEPTRRDLEEVLTAMLAGEKIEPATTKAVGCFISDLK